MPPVTREEIRDLLLIAATSARTLDAVETARLLKPIFAKWAADWVTSANAGEGAAAWSDGDSLCVSGAMSVAVTGRADFVLKKQEDGWEFDAPSAEEALAEHILEDDVDLPPIAGACLAVLSFTSLNAYRHPTS